LHNENWSLSARRHFPVIHLGASERIPCSVFVDQGLFVREAFEHLHQDGARRIAIVSNSKPIPGFQHFWQSFQRVSRKYGYHVKQAKNLFYDGNGPRSGMIIAKKLLSMPASEQPDGIIVCDDLVATGLVPVLAADPRYRPNIAVLTNKHAPVVFPIPVYHYELDGLKMAEVLRDMVVDRLYAPGMPHQRRGVAADLLSPEKTMGPM
jgi:DNA-binding LacI/PurR family transcriptional regulator